MHTLNYLTASFMIVLGIFLLVVGKKKEGSIAFGFAVTFLAFDVYLGNRSLSFI